jgi:hypothetical protein
MQEKEFFFKKPEIKEKTEKDVGEYYMEDEEIGYKKSLANIAAEINTEIELRGERKTFFPIYIIEPANRISEIIDYFVNKFNINEDSILYVDTTDNLDIDPKPLHVVIEEYAKKANQIESDRIALVVRGFDRAFHKSYYNEKGERQIGFQWERFGHDWDQDVVEDDKFFAPNKKIFIFNCVNTDNVSEDEERYLKASADMSQFKSRSIHDLKY